MDHFFIAVHAQERSARESFEQRERRDRTTGYFFRRRSDRIEESWSSHVAGGSQKTIQAFARRCLAESMKIT